MNNLLVSVLLVLVISLGAIWVSRESGLNAQFNGIPNILIGGVAVIVLLGMIV